MLNNKKYVLASLIVAALTSSSVLATTFENSMNFATAGNAQNAASTPKK